MSQEQGPGNPQEQSLPDSGEKPTQTVRILPGVEDRVESGAIQFGDDWPGLFIRGDNSMALGLALKALRPHLEKIKQDHPETIFHVHELLGLESTIFGDVIIH